MIGRALGLAALCGIAYAVGYLHGVAYNIDRRGARWTPQSESRAA